MASAGLLLLPSLAVAQTAAPQPRLLEGLFQDHAVFQRGRPIAVWGHAAPGEQVTIAFAGTTTKAPTDSSGKWSAKLPALPAGGPYQLVATTPGGGRQVVDDILVGDVWLCSGQSNMEMDLSRSLNAPGEIGSANDNQIRLLTVAHDTSLTPLASFKTPVRWQAASPASVTDFSAVCYFMARDLRSSQKVPIGLIDASWGGTAIDAWRSENAIARDPRLAERIEVLRAFRTDPVAGNRRWGALWEDMWRRNTGDARGAEPWRDAAAASPEWKAVPRLTNWESWGDPALAEFNGMLFYRTSVTLTRTQAAQSATLDIGWADDLDQTWVNEIPVGNTYGPNSSRAYVLPAGTLREGENNIVVSVLDLWGQGGMAGPEDLRALRLADRSSVPLKGPWRYRMAAREGSWPPRAPWESVAGLSTIYNGMVAPLGSYGLTGVAWYQGESDASTERGYAAKLGSMMADWRSQFGKPDLPFLVVQLAGFGASPATPQESGFATVRDEQRRAVAADRNAGLAVAIDLGDRRDIHPANKQDVGLRLARAARRIAYGEKINPSGPEVAAARHAGADVLVDFRNIEGALVTYNSDGAIGFELCGPAPGSCRFVTAKVEGNSVRLAPAAVPASRVRFCWGDSPVCNLYDRSGLPAGPFEIEIAAQPR